jgi:pimeloyl-ACP methyl ester carboxylesterase
MSAPERTSQAAAALSAGHTTVAVDGNAITLATTTAGTGAEAVLLTHGLGCARESSHAVMAAGAAGSGMRWVALDLPGHGDSRPVIVGGSLMQFYAKVVAALAQQLDVSRVHLVGHSMGGAVAVLATERIANVGAVVSVEGNLIAEDCGMVSRGIAAQSLAVFAHDGYDAFLAKLEISTDPDEQAWAAWAAEVDLATLHEAALSLVAWCDTGKVAEGWQDLERTAYVYGERSGHPKGLTELLCPETTHSIRGEGHFPMLGAPDALAAIITRAVRT